MKQNFTSGFALIVVLSALSICMLLFAISTKILIVQVHQVETDLILAQKRNESHALLRTLSTSESVEGLEARLFEHFGNTSQDHKFQDVDGLIDLNTALPSLLVIYFEAIGLNEEEIERLQSWRRQSKHFLRTDDLIRVVGTSSVDKEVLWRTATVHSRKQGVSWEVAPSELQDLISYGWDASWNTPATGSTFNVLKNDPVRVRFLGIVEISGDAPGRILWAD